jgi:hypothetical protein
MIIIYDEPVWNKEKYVATQMKFHGPLTHTADSGRSRSIKNKTKYDDGLVDTRPKQSHTSWGMKKYVRIWINADTIAGISMMKGAWTGRQSSAMNNEKRLNILEYKLRPTQRQVKRGRIKPHEVGWMKGEEWRTVKTAERMMKVQ